MKLRSETYPPVEVLGIAGVTPVMALAGTRPPGGRRDMLRAPQVPRPRFPAVVTVIFAGATRGRQPPPTNRRLAVSLMIGVADVGALS